MAENASCTQRASHSEFSWMVHEYFLSQGDVNISLYEYSLILHDKFLTGNKAKESMAFAIRHECKNLRV